MEVAEIETTAQSMGSSVQYHLINDVIGFLLYMHQQIPSILQDIHLEFDMMHIERKQLEVELASKDLKAPLRRKHNSGLREVRRGIRGFEKLINAVSSAQLALQLVLSESPGISKVILILGSSPLRPRYVYELSFLLGRISPSGSSDYNKCKEAEVLSKKGWNRLLECSSQRGLALAPIQVCLRGLHPVEIMFKVDKSSRMISSVLGPTKLFIMIKAPYSFNQPLHFLPKREFKYSKKIVPFQLRFKCRNRDQVSDKLHHQSETGSSISLEGHMSTDLIWYQCRHVIKGLVSKAALSE